ncbi:hypothetical protein D3C79_921000 [compost metagenome]
MQPYNLVVEVAEHALDLVITPFNDGQPRRARAKDVQLRGEGGQVFEGEVEACAKLVDVMRADFIFRFHQVVLGQLGRRLGQAP